MKNFISKIKQNPLLSVVFITVIAAAIFFSMSLSSYIIKPFEDSLNLDFYNKNVIGKAILLLLSLGAILLFNKGSLKNYGFQRPKKLKFGKMLGIGTAFSIGSMVVGIILFQVILRKLFPVDNPQIGFPEQQSILQMILTIWIWSSICEEVHTRGLLQSFLSNLKHKKFLRLSVPVWISGIFFGLMHISTIKIMDVWSMSFIVFNTLILGLVAAYYREKTESIYPAIFLHFWFNVIGSTPLIIKTLI